MNSSGLLADVRRRAGITQSELARRASTSRPTLSAYEHGRKSPTLDTAQRLLAQAGYELCAVPLITFTYVADRRGRQHPVPDRLPRLPLDQAMATVQLPLHLDWSAPDRTVHLADRRERARLYETVLREGGPHDVLAYIDGALLVDQWAELVLPRDIHRMWEPVVEARR
jgi:transcriptional regulator with XRE-family HTH domain